MKKIIFTILLSVLFIANVNAEDIIKANMGTPFSIEMPEQAMVNGEKISEITLKIPKVYETDIIIPDSACDSKGEDTEFGYNTCTITKESAKKKFEGIQVKRAYDNYHYTITWYETPYTQTFDAFVLDVSDPNTEIKTNTINLNGYVGENVTLKDPRVTKTEGGYGYFRHNQNNGLTPSREYDYIDKKYNNRILSMANDVTATFSFSIPTTYIIVSYYTVPVENGKKITYQTTYNINITNQSDSGAAATVKKENKTINVSVGEKFEIAKHENATEKDMEMVFSQELADTKILKIENAECYADEQGGHICYSDKGKWNMSVLQEGVYTLYVYSYASSKDGKIVYETMYDIIVTKPVEVKKEDTKVVVDNKTVLESTSNNQVVTDIKIADDSKVQVLEVKKETFNIAKEKNIDLVYEVKNANNKLAYSWTFEAKKLENKHDAELNLMVKTSEISKDLAKKFNQKNAYSLQFAYHGILPGPAKVKIYVGDKYEPKDVLDLYYNNQEQNKIESVAKKLTVDENGYVTIEINHCSEYILARADGKVLDGEPKSGDIVKLNLVTMLIGAIGLGVMIKKRA